MVCGVVGAAGSSVGRRAVGASAASCRAGPASPGGKYGKDPGDGGEQRPVAVIQPGWLGRPLQNWDLMAEHDDLKILRASRTYGERCEQTVERAEYPADSGAPNPQVNGPIG